MVRLEQASFKLSPEQQVRLKLDRVKLEQQRDQARERITDRVPRQRVEQFISSPEWQAERHKRLQWLFTLEDAMVRGTTMPLAELQAMWQSEPQPVMERERDITQYDDLCPPPSDRTTTLRCLVWEATETPTDSTDTSRAIGIMRFRFQEDGSLATLDSDTEEPIDHTIALPANTLVRPVYPVTEGHNVVMATGGSEMSISEQNRWRQLFDNYNILIQPFPQLGRLENAPDRETTLENLSQLMQEIVLLICSPSSGKYILKTVLDFIRLTLPAPGRQVELILRASETTIICRAQGTHRADGGRSAASLDVVDLVRTSISPTSTAIPDWATSEMLAEASAIERALEQYLTESLPELHVQLLRAYDAEISVATLDAYRAKKQTSGQQVAWRNFCSGLLWSTSWTWEERDTQSQTGTPVKYLRFDGEHWYDINDNRITSHTGEVKIVAPETMLAHHYKTWKDKIGPQQAFSQYWFDVGDDVNRRARRRLVLERFIQKIPIALREQLASGSLPPNIVIDPAFVITQGSADILIPRHLFSDDYDKVKRAMQTIEGVPKQEWSKKLRWLALLGQFDPAEVDLTNI